MNLLKIFLSFILLFAFTTSCKKNDLVPYKYVNFVIFLSDPEFVDLNNYYTPVLVNAGVSGIILYRKSEDEFIALDRTCTFKPSDRCKVSPDSTGLFVKCPCCESVFSLPSDGYVDKGPASRPLVQYQTYYDGFKLYVSN